MGQAETIRYSIIMPAYCEEELISFSLDSILNQDMILRYPDKFEIIVIDNGSKDDTGQVVYEKRQQGILLLTVFDKGVLAARAAGISYACGDIMISVNADSYYPPLWLNHILRHFDDPTVVAVSSVVLFQEVSSLVNMFMQLLRRLEQKMYGLASAFRKSAYEATGGFDLSIDPVDSRAIEYEEQVAFKRRLMTMGRYALDSYPVYTSYRRHTCQGSNSEYCRQVLSHDRF